MAGVQCQTAPFAGALVYGAYCPAAVSNTLCRFILLPSLPGSSHSRNSGFLIASGLGIPVVVSDVRNINYKLVSTQDTTVVVSWSSCRMLGHGPRGAQRSSFVAVEKSLITAFTQAYQVCWSHSV